MICQSRNVRVLRHKYTVDVCFHLFTVVFQKCLYICTIYVQSFDADVEVPEIEVDFVVYC